MRGWLIPAISVALFYLGGAIGWYLGAKMVNAGRSSDLELLRAALQNVRTDHGWASLSTSARTGVNGALSETSFLEAGHG